MRDVWTVGICRMVPALQKFEGYGQDADSLCVQAAVPGVAVHERHSSPAAPECLLREIFCGVEEGVFLRRIEDREEDFEHCIFLSPLPPFQTLYQN